MFKENVGAIDRALRVLAGLTMLVLFFAYPGESWRYWMLIGAVPVLTGLFSTCPLYSIAGLSTCPLNRS